jgi:hypothetical protein
MKKSILFIIALAVLSFGAEKESLDDYIKNLENVGKNSAYYKKLDINQ